MRNQKIAFIGAGNMASALIRGLVKEGFPPKSLWATDLSDEKLTALEQQCGINTSGQNTAIIPHVDIVVIAVKSQLMKVVCNEIATAVQQRKPLVISVAAGIRVDDIAKWLGAQTAIVRAMPNTPALIKAGATGLYSNANVTDIQKDLSEEIMRAVGLVLWVNKEIDMDLITALSGSGPAYFFRIMESLVTSAANLGLDPNTARILTLQTAFGAAKLALECEDDLATLRENVTSPGGTTEKGLEVLQTNGIDDLLKQVLEAASTRAAELSNEFGEK